MNEDTTEQGALGPALERLASGDPDAQRAAALELADLGDPAAIPALTKAFHTENWLVRGACVRAILAIGGTGALTDFALALHEGDARIRNAAVEIFRGMGRAIVGHLITLLDEEDPNVVRYAIELLGEIGDPGATDDILKVLERESDENVRYQGLLALGKLGTAKAIPAIRKGLGESLWVQTAALEAAAQLGHPDLEPDVLDLIGKVDIWGLPAVLDALLQIGTERSVEQLFVFIVSDEELSQLALRALAAVARKPSVQLKFDDRERVALLRVAHAALGSDDHELRLAGLAMVELFSDETAIAKVVPLLNSADTRGGVSEELEEDEPAAAARALRAIGSAVEGPLLGAFTDLDLTGQLLAINVLGRVGATSSRRLLVQLLDHEDVEINRVACEALGEMADPAALEALIFQFQHPSAPVRNAAQRALARLPGELVYEKLLPLLDDPLPEVRAMAASTLGDIGERRAEEALKHLLLDTANEVKQAAVFALAALDDRKVGSLPLLLLGNDDSVLRQSAAQVLGLLRDKRAVEPLIYLLDDQDFWVRFHAARALGAIGDDRAVTSLSRRLGDPVSPVKVAAAEALEQLMGEKAVPAVVSLAEDEDQDVRLALIEILGRLGGEEARHIVVRALVDPSWKVRHAALRIAALAPDDDVLPSIRQCLRDEHVLVRQAASALIDEVERRVGIGGPS